MNKISTLVFCLFLSFGSVFSQKIDYDNSSKWFLGLNAGATWQTTDVANKFNAGWGLTLGKSFNYNYGKKISFDIRARYLRGFWYGQDYDSTSLLNYTGSALQTYKDSLGFSVNNFQADVHRLGLELVLHANGFRERTGWDPYIFGGVGFTWHQTFGDLGSDTSTWYNYNPSEIGNTYINNIKNNTYDSPLDGSNADKFRVNFMPSLGFGIGYQVGKRVTLGLEHKTTFTMIDDFDGFVDPTSKYKDIYHYTSAYVQFRFKAHKGTTNTEVNNVDNINNYNNNLTSSGCISPTIKFINPVSNGLVSSAINYQVVLEIKDILGRDNIVFKQNGVTNLNYIYNAETDRLESTVILVPGINTFDITATNTCGSDMETITVNYQPCTAPEITKINPSTNGTTVGNANYSLTAMIQNSNNGQGITLTHNERGVTNYTFNTASGSFESNVTLAVGLNTFVLTSVNSCGTDVETITVNYQNCVAPIINIVNPTTNGSTVSSASFNLSGLVLNSNNGQGITLKQNNVSVTNFSFNNTNNAFQSNVTLAPGLNTFVLTSVNSCGTDIETVTVTYNNCVAPVVTIVSPTSNGTTVSSPSLSLSALILNSNNGQGITLKQNNVSVTNFSFNNATGSLQSTVTLTPGLNTFVLTSVNSCGTDIETVTVTYNNCVAPVVTIVSPTSNGTTVSSPSFSLSALILNSNNGQGITLKQNNVSVTNFSFNNATGSLQSTVTLAPGLNTFVLTSVNSCGTDIETITVTYNNCVPPVVTFTNPTISGTTFTSSSFNLGALIQNSNNGQGITLGINGRAITNFSFSNANGVFQSTLNLVPGLNTITLTSVNPCGTDTETITIIYDNCIAPVIALIAPATNSTTVTLASFNFSVSVTNSNNGQGITLTQNGQSITNFTFNNGTSTLESNITLIPGLNTFVVTVLNSCGTDSKTVTVFYKKPVVEEQIISICHRPPGNPENTQTLEIPLSAWPAHQAHGDVLGPCPIVEEPVVEEKITICHHPPGNPTNTQVLEIPLSAWPAHQAHGDNLGPCPIVEEPVVEEKITICHHPPGNPTNTQVLEIPLSAWPAHQAHGDNLGPCPIVEEPVVEEKITICHHPPGNPNNTQVLEIPLSAWPAHQAHGDNLGPCPIVEEPVVEDQIISICHHPPGNPENTQNLQIPLSAWPAHQAHGDALGTCPPVEENNGNGNNSGNEGGNNSEGTGLTNEIGNGQQIIICHHPPGNPENTQTLEIPLSAWPAHQAHGDALGACPEQNNNDGGSNGNSEEGGNGNGNHAPQSNDGGTPKSNIKPVIKKKAGESKPAAEDKTPKPSESKPVEDEKKEQEIPPTPPKAGKGK